MKTTILPPLRCAFFLLVALVVISQSQAQLSTDRRSVSRLDYITELQSNFRDRSNWINMLLVENDTRLWRNGDFGVQLISSFKADSRPIINDLQGFSGIESHNMWVNIFRFGYMHQWKKVAVFGGLRSSNHDFFLTPYTSLFAHSSSGIYPTLSANFPMANYPRSAMSVDVSYHISQKFILNSSLYNGIAREVMLAGWSLFSVKPRTEGLHSITEFGFIPQPHESPTNYRIGASFHTRHMAPNSFEKELIPENPHFNYVFWGYIEQRLLQTTNGEVGLIVQGSAAAPRYNHCYHYLGIGGLITGVLRPEGEDQLGMMLNLAHYDQGHETSLELTWQYPIFHHLTMQPVFEYIHSIHQNYYVGMLRFSYKLGF